MMCLNLGIWRLSQFNREKILLENLIALKIEIESHSFVFTFIVTFQWKVKLTDFNLW